MASNIPTHKASRKPINKKSNKPANTASNGQTWRVTNQIIRQEKNIKRQVTNQEHGE